MAEGTRLVGRAGETAELEAEFQLATAGALRCVLLTGDPGVGKTALADDVAARHGGVAITLSARARPLGGVASFGLWAEARSTPTSGIFPPKRSPPCAAAPSTTWPACCAASARCGAAFPIGSRPGPGSSRASDDELDALATLFDRLVAGLADTED